MSFAPRKERLLIQNHDMLSWVHIWRLIRGTCVHWGEL
jgi:hypothetical protein